jgi:hypothetical protein
MKFGAPDMPIIEFMPPAGAAAEKKKGEKPNEKKKN